MNYTDRQGTDKKRKWEKRKEKKENKKWGLEHKISEMT